MEPSEKAYQKIIRHSSSRRLRAQARLAPFRDIKRTACKENGGHRRILERRRKRHRADVLAHLFGRLGELLPCNSQRRLSHGNTEYLQLEEIAGEAAGVITSAPSNFPPIF